MKIPFVRTDTGRRAEGLPGFELKNLFPAGGDDLASLARAGPALVQPAGARLWADRSIAGVNRGLFRFPGAAGSKFYAVTGTTLEALDANGAPTALGTITGTDPVFWDMVRGYLLVCANGLVHYTTGGAPTQITDADLGTISSIASMDGRLIALREGSDTFVYSDVLAPGTIGSLSFATSEAFGDDLVRCLVWQRNLYFVNRRSTEIWGATGSSSTPFARIGGAVEPVGSPAKYSPAMIGPDLYMIANSKEDDVPFVAALAPGLEVISDHAIEAKLRALSAADLAAVRGFAWRQRRQSFYGLAFPDGSARVCHLDSRTWFERRTGRTDTWVGACTADAHGKQMVASTRSGAIYELAEDCYEDAGLPMRRVATAYMPADAPTPLSTLLVDALGVEGPGPYEAIVEISRDDGKTWSAGRKVLFDGAGFRAPLSFGWGAIRRPGAIARVTVEGPYRAGLFNLLANERST